MSLGTIRAIRQARQWSIFPWIVLAVGILASFLVFSIIRESVEHVARLRFEREADTSVLVNPDFQLCDRGPAALVQGARQAQQSHGLGHVNLFDAGQNALQFTPSVLKTQKAGGTFSDVFHPGDFINRHPLFFWLLESASERIARRNSPAVDVAAPASAPSSTAAGKAD